jgi:hypothetical protein
MAMREMCNGSFLVALQKMLARKTRRALIDDPQIARCVTSVVVSQRAWTMYGRHKGLSSPVKGLGRSGLFIYLCFWRDLSVMGETGLVIILREIVGSRAGCPKTDS